MIMSAQLFMTLSVVVMEKHIPMIVLLQTWEYLTGIREDAHK